MITSEGLEFDEPNELMLSHQLADGRMVYATDAEDARAKCSVLGAMPPEQANALIALSALGNTLMAEQAKPLRSQEAIYTKLRTKEIEPVVLEAQVLSEQISWLSTEEHVLAVETDTHAVGQIEINIQLARQTIDSIWDNKEIISKEVAVVAVTTRPELPSVSDKPKNSETHAISERRSVEAQSDAPIKLPEITLQDVLSLDSHNVALKLPEYVSPPEPEPLQTTVHRTSEDTLTDIEPEVLPTLPELILPEPFELEPAEANVYYFEETPHTDEEPFVPEEEFNSLRMEVMDSFTALVPEETIMPEYISDVDISNESVPPHIELAVRIQTVLAESPPDTLVEAQPMIARISELQADLEELIMQPNDETLLVKMLELEVVCQNLCELLNIDVSNDLMLEFMTALVPPELEERLIASMTSIEKRGTHEIKLMPFVGIGKYAVDQSLLNIIGMIALLKTAGPRQLLTR